MAQAPRPAHDTVGVDAVGVRFGLEADVMVAAHHWPRRAVMLAEGTDVAVADGEKFNLWERGG